MKVYVLDGLTVHAALRIGKQHIHSLCVLRRGAVRLDIIKKCEYFTHGCVVVMPVMMVLSVRFLALFMPVDHNADMCAGYAALAVGRGGDDGAPVQRAVEPREKRLPVRVQLQERAHEHIACRAHCAVKIECFHRLFFLASVSILISSKYLESAAKSSSLCSCARPSWSAVNCSRAEPPLVRTRKSVYPREKR